MSELVVVFGSTGGTGKHVVRKALEAGLKVRAFARSPDKIPEDLRAHENLEVFQGDLTDADAIDRAVDGATLVVSTAGDPKLSKTTKFMTAFATQVVTSMREHGVKRFVYQAGAFSPHPERDDLGGFTKVLRVVMGPLLGISGMLEDNDGVIRMLASDASDLDWTATRPGMLQDKGSRGALKAIDKPGSAVDMADLAAFTLEIGRSGQYIRDCPFVGY